MANFKNWPSTSDLWMTKINEGPNFPSANDQSKLKFETKPNPSFQQAMTSILNRPNLESTSFGHSWRKKLGTVLIRTVLLRTPQRYRLVWPKTLTRTLCIRLDRIQPTIRKTSTSPKQFEALSGLIYFFRTFPIIDSIIYSRFNCCSCCLRCNKHKFFPTNKQMDRWCENGKGNRCYNCISG